MRLCEELHPLREASSRRFQIVRFRRHRQLSVRRPAENNPKFYLSGPSFQNIPHQERNIPRLGRCKGLQAGISRNLY